MLLALFIAVWCLQISDGFRGPHHPRSPVSHHHYTPQRDVKLTEDSQLLHDTGHLVEDMGHFGEHIDIATMNEQELEFYYFRTHDLDNNTKLDGLELLHAIQHTFHEHVTVDNNIEEVPDVDPQNQIQLVIDLIDKVLEEDDLDNDGYLGYTEYVLARQKTKEDADSVPNDLKLEII